MSKNVPQLEVCFLREKAEEGRSTHLSSGRVIVRSFVYEGASKRIVLLGAFVLPFEACPFYLGFTLLTVPLSKGTCVSQEQLIR